MRLEAMMLRYPGATPVYANDPPHTVRAVVPPAAAAPAPAAPVASRPPLPLAAKPTLPKAGPPKREPFARALQAVCGPGPGLSVPWHLPESEKAPTQATDSRTRKWDKVMRNVVAGNPRYSMPDEHTR
jgi:hypothetical protein